MVFVVNKNRNKGVLESEVLGSLLGLRRMGTFASLKIKNQISKIKNDF
jgi:hypothetical protein